MTSFNALPRSVCQVLLITTAIFLFAGAQDAAGRGGGNSGDHGGMSGHQFGPHSEGMNVHESQRNRDRGDTEPKASRLREDRHQQVDQRMGKRDKRRGTSATASTGAASAPGSAATNTIHPIVTKPAQPPASGPTAGKLPPNDPVGNTHPTPGPNTSAPVTVSNGVTTTQIQNGLGGVTVYSDKPGTITVTNGKESTTLSGASVTLSGNVVGVGGGQGVEVGSRNGEGNTVVAIKPSPAPPLPNDGKVDFKSGGGPGVDVLNGVSDFGYGVAHGFAPGPTPPPATSTIQQQ